MRSTLSAILLFDWHASAMVTLFSRLCERQGTYHESLEGWSAPQGHTSGLYCLKFLPQCDNTQIISSASDRQARFLWPPLKRIHPSCQQPPQTPRGHSDSGFPCTHCHAVAGSESKSAVPAHPCCAIPRVHAPHCSGAKHHRCQVWSAQASASTLAILPAQADSPAARARSGADHGPAAQRVAAAEHEGPRAHAGDPG